MDPDEVERLMKQFLDASEVVAGAMCAYATSVTGTKWRKECFAFEADHVVAELQRAGYEFKKRSEKTECATSPSA